MRGLSDLRECVHDFKKNIVLPQLDNALDVSEQWKGRTPTMPSANDDEDNQQSSNESEKVQRLENILVWLAKNKQVSYGIPHDLQIDCLSGLHDKVYTIVITPPFLKEATQDHFLISTTRHNQLIQYLIASLSRWEKRVDQHHYNQVEISKMKGSPYEAPYKLYLHYLQMSIELYSKTNDLIKTLDMLVLKHRMFWAAILIIGGAVYFKETTVFVIKCLYAYIQKNITFLQNAFAPASLSSNIS